VCECVCVRTRAFVRVCVCVCSCACVRVPRILVVELALHKFAVNDANRLCSAQLLSLLVVL